MPAMVTVHGNRSTLKSTGASSHESGALASGNVLKQMM